MIEVRIETENDAFQGDAGQHERARILRTLAKMIEEGLPITSVPLSDSNGNRCGHYRELPDRLSELERRVSSYELGFTDGLCWALVHLTELGELRNAIYDGDQELLAQLASAATVPYRTSGGNPEPWSEGDPFERVKRIQGGAAWR